MEGEENIVVLTAEYMGMFSLLMGIIKEYDCVWYKLLEILL